MSKKGLSPVIAVVLLVALVLVLATIIYLWAGTFIPETIEKSGEPIENSCMLVVFEPSCSGTTLTVQNNGNVPIYGIRYAIEGAGSLDYQDRTGEGTIFAGRSYDYKNIPGMTGKTIRVIPILLGKTSTGELKAFACEDETMQSILC